MNQAKIMQKWLSCQMYQLGKIRFAGGSPKAKRFAGKTANRFAGLRWFAGGLRVVCGCFANRNGKGKGFATYLVVANPQTGINGKAK